MITERDRVALAKWAYRMTGRRCDRREVATLLLTRPTPLRAPPYTEITIALREHQRAENFRNNQRRNHYAKFGSEWLERLKRRDELDRRCPMKTTLRSDLHRPPRKRCCRCRNEKNFLNSYKDYDPSLCDDCRAAIHNAACTRFNYRYDYRFERRDEVLELCVILTIASLTLKAARQNSQNRHRPAPDVSKA